MLVSCLTHRNIALSRSGRRSSGFLTDQHSTATKIFFAHSACEFPSSGGKEGSRSCQGIVRNRLTYIIPDFSVRVEDKCRTTVRRSVGARTENYRKCFHSALAPLPHALSLSWESSMPHGSTMVPARADAFDAAVASAHAAPLSCPHCRCDRVTHWGAAHGIPRYRCGACRRTFNILTNTPLARLRNKERWLTFVGTMFERKSLRKRAAACGVSVTTSCRWHKRFLECSAAQRAEIVRQVIGAVARVSALGTLPESASAPDIEWAKDLLPVVLSWLV